MRAAFEPGRPADFSAEDGLKYGEPSLRPPGMAALAGHEANILCLTAELETACPQSSASHQQEGFG